MECITKPLAEHTSLKIGGPAEIAIPESKSELVDLLTECYEESRPYRILGNGSNLLVADKGVDELVIKITDASTNLSFNGSHADVGASVMVPQFINACIQKNLGGYEYLYSVPGTIGGAIYMNAGRGPAHEMTIADYLVSVEVFAEGSVREISADKMSFEHRYSSFHDNSEWVILSATFDLPTQPSNEGREKARERMQKVRRRERSKPNAGSVFKSGARFPVHKIPPNGLSVGDARFVEQNRICNDGNATCRDVERLITRAKWFHRLVPPFEDPQIEWEIWK
ncbi:UDP-N-acetylmuramate dehydrogenase [Haloprofundus salilacus]|uniref:UDP-N-acetylmuramate dehydrogenase n=1 Tax=Haloprofundus salilacus TaxID=2876190 RepID=UPI001CCE1BD4|nr:FAD-binding protein [Haloprofundus salilacus]